MTHIRSNVVIIGEAPGASDSGRMPLFGTSSSRAGWRLREMAGLTRSEWTRVRRVNLIPDLPDRWPADLARLTADAWMHSLLRGHDVILLGRRVQRAFGLEAEPCVWVDCGGGTRLSRIPHPSGRNLQYNDPRFRARVGRFLRKSLIED